MPEHKKNASWVSKANHTQIINDNDIKLFLDSCKSSRVPSREALNANEECCNINGVDLGCRNILTIDGSYTVVEVNKDFPSSQIAFFQFGAILFTTDDLSGLSELPFIAPEDMEKLHNLQRQKLAIPVKNVVSNNKTTLNESIRKALFEFFNYKKPNEFSLNEVLSWLIFEEYKQEPKDSYTLATNPNLNSSKGSIVLKRSEMSSDYTFVNNGEIIYLTDVFRLHEVIDEEFGAAGTLGYVSRLVEQFILFRYIRVVYENQPRALRDFVFISNGPLSFSGQTANMHKVFRSFCNYLIENYALYLLGIEKNGAFVEHALNVTRKDRDGFCSLKKGTYLLLSNDYIYKYITPGDPNKMHYGSTSYYGGKVIVHTEDGQVFVITVPIKDSDVIKNPSPEKYKNLEDIIAVIQLLKCDLYEDSIVPVALANKLISLTSYPGKLILENFAKKIT